MGNGYGDIMLGALPLFGGAYSSIQAGKAEAQAAEFERAQYENQKQISMIQGLDEETDRQRRLQQVLASNKASTAAMGVSSTGRSFLAVQQGNISEATRDIGRIRLNTAGSVNSANLASLQAKFRGKSAIKSGYIGAGQSILNTGKNAAMLYK